MTGEMVQGPITPRPDPTLLTTEQLMREISRLEALIELQFRAIDEKLTAETNLTKSRFEGTETARESVRMLIEQEVKYADAERRSLAGTFVEKFAGIAEQHAALREMLNERYATQTKALDAAFLAQQAAVATSFDASEKAMAAALLAAKEAVEKANTATEKRFDGVNELLGQQTATVAALLPRAEAEARITALDARLTDLKSTVDKGFTGVDVRQSIPAEQRGIRDDTRGQLSIVMAGVSIFITLMLAMVTAIHLWGH